MPAGFKNSRKLWTNGQDPNIPVRLLNLENNEYKVTYYEIISGASGSLTLPGGATINAGEFGLSGNCILSKIDGSNKPTFESPKTSGGVVVTASLDETDGSWVASGTYTDSNVALIYSIKIKAVNYSNLTYDRIIETVELTDFPISQTITDGITNKAPSEDAVFDALGLKAPIASPTFTGTVTSPIILVSGTAGNGYIDITNQSSDPSSPSSGVSRVFIDTLGKLSKKNSLSTKSIYRDIIYSDLTTSSAVTGTTSNTLIKSGLVKGSTFNTSATDSIKIECRLLKTGTAGTWTQRLYVNTSNSLSGARLLGTQGGSAANTFLNIQRNGIIKSTTNTEFLETSTSVSGDEATAASAGSGGVTTVNIDHTIDQYYIQSVQNANTGDSSVSSYLKIFRD